MSIWNDYTIRVWAESGGVNPYDPQCINPASIDLRWSGRYREIEVTGSKKDGTLKADWGETNDVDFMMMEPNKLYLLDSLEYITMPQAIAGFLCLKSSTGRRGIEHMHAGYFDPGFHGTATWEMHSLWPIPVKILRGQRLMQLVLEEARQPVAPYTSVGRYAGQTGPTAERAPK